MESAKENILKLHKQKNVRLYILYKMLANDLLFYYSISYLFLVNFKGFSTSQIVFADAFYPLLKLFFQVPCTILIQKIGKKNSLIFANLGVAIYILLTIGSINTFTLILANVFLAFGFVVKGMAESNLLFDSIEESDKKRELFSKYEGRSWALYYLTDAVSAVVSGFLFTFNPYLPMTLSLTISILAIFIVLKFHEIPVLKDNSEVQNITAIKEIKIYFKDLTQAFKYISKSSRLRALILFNALFASILSLTNTLQKSLLNDANISSESFGIIFAVISGIACLASLSTVYIHKKLRNKTLSVFGITYLISVMLSATVLLLDLPLFLMYYILLIMTAIQYFIRGPFYTLINQYLNSFCDSSMRLKIYSAKALLEFITATLLSLVSSAILSYLSNSLAILWIGSLSFIIMVILINYMSTRVGLKPEDYSKKDIFCK